VPKKSITLIGLNTFSLRQQQNHEQDFKNLFWTDEQVWMDETCVTILLFEIQSSSFVFLNL